MLEWLREGGGGGAFTPGVGQGLLKSRQSRPMYTVYSININIGLSLIFPSDLSHSLSRSLYLSHSLSLSIYIYISLSLYLSLYIPRSMVIYPPSHFSPFSLQILPHFMLQFCLKLVGGYAEVYCVQCTG